MGVEVRMPADHFNSVIRMVKNSQIDRVEQIRRTTYARLKEIGVGRDLNHAIDGTPKGSDQTNMGNILSWIGKVEANDSAAVQQLLAIDATTVQRMGK